MREPEPGDLVEIHWPGGPCNFTIRFAYLSQVHAPGWEGWVVLNGLVVEPRGPQHRAVRNFYARPVNGRYEMLPKS